MSKHDLSALEKSIEAAFEARDGVNVSTRGEVRDAVKEPARAEYADLMRLHVKLGGRANDKLPPSDRYYLSDRVRAERFRFDSKEINAYFEVRSVIQGLLDVTAEMYGLEYKAIPANAWHPDVTAYEVWSGGKAFGKFYLDLYPRPGKYKHAAMFPIRTPAKLADGRYLTPMAALATAGGATAGVDAVPCRLVARAPSTAHNRGPPMRV